MPSKQVSRVEVPKEGSRLAEDTKPFVAGYVCLVGEPNSGKSTLLNSLVGVGIAPVSAKAQMTRKNLLGVCSTPSAQFLFVDSPGILLSKQKSLLNKRLQRETKDAVLESNACLLVLDAYQVKRGAPNLESLFRSVMELPLLVVLNKTDLLEKEALLPILANVSVLLDRLGITASLLPISAKTGEGVLEILPLLEKLLPESPAFYSDDAITDEPSRSVCEELIRAEVFEAVHQEIPYGCAVEIEKWEEKNNLVAIGAQIIVSKDSHKGIVLGKKGVRIRHIGIQARKRIESLLGSKVHLETFVRVDKNWNESSAGLSRVGL